MNPILQVIQIDTFYDTIAALRNVSIDVYPGEIVAIIGANGAGKTTLLNSISGILPLRQGEIKFKSININNLPAWKIARLGIVQIPEGRKIFPKLTVLENMELGAFPVKDFQQVKYKITEMYSLFPILADRKLQPAGTLSGGEQQMLAIARGLMANPELLMFDEPSMGLAPVIVEKVWQIIQVINQKGISILLVEQNAKKSLEIAQRAYVLETGRVIATDTTDKLINHELIKKSYLGI